MRQLTVSWIFLYSKRIPRNPYWQSVAQTSVDLLWLLLGHNHTYFLKDCMLYYFCHVETASLIFIKNYKNNLAKVYTWYMGLVLVVKRLWIFVQYSSFFNPYDVTTSTQFHIIWLMSSRKMDQIRQFLTPWRVKIPIGDCSIWVGRQLGDCKIGQNF